MLHLKFRLRFSLTALFLLALSLFFAYPLCAQSAERKVCVAARICPPFVMNDTGQFSGISIFLWDKITEPQDLAKVKVGVQALLSVRDTPEWKLEIVKYIGKR